MEGRVRGPHGVAATPAPRFSIGIDLGTTNTALAFVSLDGDDPSEILAIPQLESPVAIVEAPTLPSFLYLPEGVATFTDSSSEGDGDRDWVIGRLARIRAAESPGRVAHSAKSWLGHHSADRSAAFLPWGSDDIAGADKISPVRASALILGYVREAWNDRFAGNGPGFAFDAQLITVTVPASFDAVAQRLTLAAAQEAGFPERVRLLEEPQAALYRWLELHDSADELPAALSGMRTGSGHVLVVDIGGGTSDFSLFAFHSNAGDDGPRIKRIAVSDHILLGGDNMDLALAHRLEPELIDDGEPLSGRGWGYLVARCRDIKETALSTEGPPDEMFSVSIPARGSGLIAGVRSARLARSEIERLVLDGFFPECYADEGPIRARTAVRESGLPYARDPGVTRHLADFLRDRPPVDAVLFNGGALYPLRLRRRMCTEIGKWQSGSAPSVLENTEPDLAVARGAARFGKTVYLRAQHIEAGTAHAIFLQAHRASEDDAAQRPPSLVCVLPAGAPSERTFAIADLALELRINRPVRFQTYSSARRRSEIAGELVDWNERDFRALPPLETLVKALDPVHLPTSRAGAKLAAPSETVPVSLTTRLSELGRLEISCVSADPDIRGSWPLEFNLRLQEPNGSGKPGEPPAFNTSGETEPRVAAAALAAARARIATLFGQPFNPRDKLTATRLIKSLEAILGLPKSQWNVILVRSLWATLERCIDDREKSVEHEEAWLHLAGFLLRPGFGAALDDVRIDELWTLRESGLFFAAKTVTIAEYVLWRRVAGGLSGERQENILEPDLTRIRAQANPAPELVLLAGSLERIAIDRKTELIDRFITAASTHEREKTHNAHFLGALAALLNRTPLYGGPETVVSPDLVQRAFEAFSRFDWEGPKRMELQALFLRAARAVNDRSIDVPRALRNRIADKLEKSGVAPSKTAPLRGYTPLQRAEQAGNFGESLPPGLILRDR